MALHILGTDEMEVRFFLGAPLEVVMFDKSFEIGTKILLGKDVTDDERKYWRSRSAKYEIVRYVYMEKMNHDKAGLVDFHFTPGESFDDMPIIDIVNELLKFNEGVKNGTIKVERLDFGDSSWFNNPPHNGKEKTNL